MISVFSTPRSEYRQISAKPPSRDNESLQAPQAAGSKTAANTNSNPLFAGPMWMCYCWGAREHPYNVFVDRDSPRKTPPQWLQTTAWHTTPPCHVPWITWVCIPVIAIFSSCAPQTQRLHGQQYPLWAHCRVCLDSRWMHSNPARTPGLLTSVLPQHIYCKM